MNLILALVLALNPEGTGTPFRVTGWLVQVCKAGQLCRFTPKPFPSESECREMAIVLPLHSNFEGWSARCVWFDGELQYTGRG